VLHQLLVYLDQLELLVPKELLVQLELAVLKVSLA
jgi:hypothetical protein